MSLAHAEAAATPPDARIDTVEAEFAVPNPRGPLGAPERLLAAVRAELLPALSDVLEQEPYRSAQISLPHIEIDLGTWPEDPPWAQVRAHLADQLRRLLEPHLAARAVRQDAPLVKLDTSAPPAPARSSAPSGPEDASRQNASSVPQLTPLLPPRRSEADLPQSVTDATARWSFLDLVGRASPETQAQAARAHLAEQPADHAPLRAYLAQEARFAALYGALFARPAVESERPAADPLSASERVLMAQIADLETMEPAQQVRALVALVRATPDFAALLRALAERSLPMGPLGRVLSAVVLGQVAVDDTGMPRDPSMARLASHARPADLAVLTAFLRSLVQQGAQAPAKGGEERFAPDAAARKLALSAARMTLQSVLPSRRARALVELVTRTPGLLDSLRLEAGPASGEHAVRGPSMPHPRLALGAEIDAARADLSGPEVPESDVGAVLLAALVKLRGPRQFAALLRIVSGAPERLQALRLAVSEAAATQAFSPPDLSPLVRSALRLSASEAALLSVLGGGFGKADGPGVSAQDDAAAREKLLAVFAQRAPALPALVTALSGQEEAVSRAIALRALGSVEIARMVQAATRDAATRVTHSTGLDPVQGDQAVHILTGDAETAPWLPASILETLRTEVSPEAETPLGPEIRALWQAEPARVLAALQAFLSGSGIGEDMDAAARARAASRFLDRLDRAQNPVAARPVTPAPSRPATQVTSIPLVQAEALRASLGLAASVPLGTALAQVWTTQPQRFMAVASKLDPVSVQTFLSAAHLTWAEILRSDALDPVQLRALWRGHSGSLRVAMEELSAPDLKTHALRLLPTSATVLRARLEALQQEAADPAAALRAALIALLEGRPLDFETLPKLRADPGQGHTPTAAAISAEPAPAAPFAPARTPFDILVGALASQPSTAPDAEMSDVLAFLVEILAPVEVRAIFDQIMRVWPDSYRPVVPLQAGLLAPLLEAPSGLSDGAELVAQVHAALRAVLPDASDRTTVLRLLAVRLGAAPSSAPAGASADAGITAGTHPRLRRIANEVIRTILATEAAPTKGPRAGVDEMRKAAPLPPPIKDPSEPLPITEAAGLVLLRPYLGMLFTRLDVVPQDGRLPRDLLPRAWAILDALSTTGPEDALKRVLLGLPLDHPKPDPAHMLEPDATEMIDGLLRAVIAHWSKLGATSPEGLQQTFIARTGRLSFEETGIQLKVVPGPFDMLLDGLPWSYSPFALPWMPQPIFVKWRGDDA